MAYGGLVLLRQGECVEEGAAEVGFSEAAREVSLDADALGVKALGKLGEHGARVIAGDEHAARKGPDRLREKLCLRVAPSWQKRADRPAGGDRGLRVGVVEGGAQ